MYPTLADIEREAVRLEIRAHFDTDWIELQKGERYSCFPINDEGIEAAYNWLSEQRVAMEISDLLRTLF